MPKTETLPSLSCQSGNFMIAAINDRVARAEREDCVTSDASVTSPYATE